MSKSAVFAMHMCANTKEELGDAMKFAGDFAKAATGVGEEGLDTASELQDAATELQDVFGKAGDPVASDLMQTAIKFAGDFEKTSKKTVKLADKLKDLKKKAEGLKGKDMTDFDTMVKAEATMDDIDKTAAK